MPKTASDLTRNSYYSMLSRCNNPNVPEYIYYGGRGISVCPRWSGTNGFLYFQLDMGIRPKGKSLDRIDPLGDYTPSNCRWATKSEQARNKVKTPKVRINGQIMSVADASDYLLINRYTVYDRMRQGMSIIEALKAPVRSDNPTQRNQIVKQTLIESV